MRNKNFSPLFKSEAITQQKAKTFIQKTDFTVTYDVFSIGVKHSYNYFERLND